MDEVSSLFERFLRSYQRNEVIFEEGNQGDEMFIIHRGSVRILKKTTGGEERSLSILGPGEFFGEMALIDNSPRSASAIAEEQDTQLIVLDKSKFTYMVQQLPDFSLAIMRKLSQRLREINMQRVSDLDG
jgi:CRP/FNR family cyclic AMP-dependent transcriptional regulator